MAHFFKKKNFISVNQTLVSVHFLTVDLALEI